MFNLVGDAVTRNNKKYRGINAYGGCDSFNIDNRNFHMGDWVMLVMRSNFRLTS